MIVAAILRHLHPPAQKLFNRRHVVSPFPLPSLSVGGRSNCLQIADSNSNESTSEPSTTISSPTMTAGATGFGFGSVVSRIGGKQGISAR